MLRQFRSPAKRKEISLSCCERRRWIVSTRWSRVLVLNLEEGLTYKEQTASFFTLDFNLGFTRLQTASTPLGIGRSSLETSSSRRLHNRPLAVYLILPLVFWKRTLCNPSCSIVFQGTPFQVPKFQKQLQFLFQVLSGKLKSCLPCCKDFWHSLLRQEEEKKLV